MSPIYMLMRFEPTKTIVINRCNIYSAYSIGISQDLQCVDDISSLEGSIVRKETCNPEVIDIRSSDHRLNVYTNSLPTRIHCNFAS